MKKRPKICIVGLKCYDLLAETQVPRFIGGIETQLVLLAQGLVDEGCEVVFITYDHGQSDEEMLKGVRVLKTYRLDQGIRTLRWIDRARSLWATMGRADADIYLQMGAGLETGLVARGCRKRQGRQALFVYCLASDLDYDEMFHTGRFGWEGKIYRYGLRRATLVIAQTQRQQKALQQRLSLNSRVIPMAASSPTSRTNGTAKNGLYRVVWVGRAAKEKRVEWLLEVARRCPEFQFQVIGTANFSSDYSTGILRDAKHVKNVEWVGRVAPKDMHGIYRNAQVLLNTSICEGFPTTFLEAWSHGLPVVTTFDSDGIVARNGVGRVSKTVEELANALQELRGDSSAYSRISKAAKRYYEENHTISVVARRFRSAFEEILSGDSKG